MEREGVDPPSPAVVVLGSGQDGGVPQFGDRAAPPVYRTASSLAVLDRDRVLLLDVSPDLRLQWIRHLAASVAAVDAVAITHAHMGHYAGLVHFGRESADLRAVDCWVTPSVATLLTGHLPWSALVDEGNVVIRRAGPGETVPVWEGLEMTFHPVPHRADRSDTVAIGLRWAVSGWSLLYLPDIDDWDRWPEAASVVGSYGVAMLDATFADADEVPGRPVADIPHPLVTDTLERFRHLSPTTRLILTHLNRTNRLNDPLDSTHRSVAAAGFEVAFDGMVLRPGDRR